MFPDVRDPDVRQGEREDERVDSWEFVEDDEGFFAWLEANPNGYFVNVVPGLYDHGILHAARCGHVHRSAGPWTNTRKMCAETQLVAMRWARTQLRGTPRRCRDCI